MAKILCPVDFSDTSLNALEFAVRIAERKKCVLTLINVFTESEFNKIVDKSSAVKTFKELLALATKKLQNIANEIIADSKAKGLVDCETIVELGDLQDRIIDLSGEGYDMIVMGTTGVGKNLIIGSNTSRVIQKSAIPVFCVPQQAGYDGFRRIVYATDVQQEDKVMIQRVVSFATIFQSRVNVLHISHDGHEAEKEIVEDFFSELKTFVPYDKISFESRIFKLELSQALLEYMEEIKGDLLVVYSKHRNFLEKIMHKSLSRKLSLIVNKPLFVIK